MIKCVRCHKEFEKDERLYICDCNGMFCIKCIKSHRGPAYKGVENYSVAEYEKKMVVDRLEI